MSKYNSRLLFICLTHHEGDTRAVPTHAHCALLHGGGGSWMGAPGWEQGKRKDWTHELIVFIPSQT